VTPTQGWRWKKRFATKASGFSRHEVAGGVRKGRTGESSFNTATESGGWRARKSSWPWDESPPHANWAWKTSASILKTGRIVTNASMQTSVPHIYAAGDCTSRHQIVHIGVEQGEIAARNIIHPRKKQSIDYRLLCSVVFTDPHVAVVGLTEKRAAELNIPCLTASHSFNDHGKAMIMGSGVAL